MENSKKLLSLLLSFLLIMGMAGVAPTAFAEDEERTIAEDETLTVVLSDGAAEYVKFVPERDGRYTLTSAYAEDLSLDPRARLYDSDKSTLLASDYYGASNGNFCLKYDFTAGETYYFLVDFSYSWYSGAFDITLKHAHQDLDGDLLCDVCGVRAFYELTVDEFTAVEILPGESATLIFNCETAGVFGFYIKDMASYMTRKIYDPDGVLLGDFSNSTTPCELTAGVYTVEISNNSADTTANESYSIYHKHADSNGDYLCDICGLTISYDFTEDEPISFEMYAVDPITLFFTCEKTGSYYVCYDQTYSNDYVSYTIYLDGTIYGYPGSTQNLEQGKTYEFRFSRNYGYSEDTSVMITAVIKHVHADSNGDLACDMCGAPAFYVLNEDEPLAVEIAGYDNISMTFTPENGGYYTFCYDGPYVYPRISPNAYFYDYICSEYNGGNSIYSFEGGTTYTITIISDGDYVLREIFTLSHAHSSPEETLADPPSAAAFGLNSIVCETCGKTVYRPVRMIGRERELAHEGDFDYLIMQDDKGNREAIIVSYKGEGPEAVIPEQVGGIPVTCIYSITSDFLFGILGTNKNVTSVIIPEGVKTIGEYAFAASPALESVTIPDSVTVIGRYAFYGCAKLKSVNLGSGIKYIGEKAFNADMTEGYPIEYLEAQLEEIEEEMSQTKAEMERYAQEMQDYLASYFEERSEELGAEITSWDDLYACLDSLNEDEWQEIFGDASYDDIINEIDETKAQFDTEVFMFDSYVELLDDYVETVTDLINVENPGVEAINYAGSEDDWAAVTSSNSGISPESTEVNYDFDSETHEHTWEESEVIKEATCTEQGKVKYVCSVCRESETRDTETVPHTPGEWEVETEPTATSAGKKVIKCTVCGEVLEEDVIPATGDSAELAKAKEEAKKAVNGRVEDGCSKAVKDIAAKAAEDIDKASSEEEVNSIKDAAIEKINNQREKDCSYCGLEHGGFFGWFIRTFHSVLAFFSGLFGNKRNF